MNWRRGLAWVARHPEWCIFAALLFCAMELHLIRSALDDGISTTATLDGGYTEVSGTVNVSEVGSIKDTVHVRGTVGVE